MALKTSLKHFTFASFKYFFHKTTYISFFLKFLFKKDLNSHLKRFPLTLNS